MKYWHFMAQVMSKPPEMSLLNTVSGIFNTPNTMNAAETMNHLEQYVIQKVGSGHHLAFAAFSLVEQDDEEPSTLTDEDIAQHRRDDKVDAVFRADLSHLKQLSQEELKARFDEMHLQPCTTLTGGKTVEQMNAEDERAFAMIEALEQDGWDRGLPANGFPREVRAFNIGGTEFKLSKAYKKIVRACYHCGLESTRLDVYQNNGRCPRCQVEHDKNQRPCERCGLVTTRPDGVHYCNGELGPRV